MCHFVKFCLLVLMLANSMQAQAMTFLAPKHTFEEHFSWITNFGTKDRIYASGVIDENSVANFEQLVADQNIKDAYLFFDSPGGDMKAAMQLGNKIRKLGFNTGIAVFSNGAMLKSGTCASACAYAFAGGIGRFYDSSVSKLGLHQFHSLGREGSLKEGQVISGVLVAYLKMMGVDPLAFSLSVGASPDEMFWLDSAQALELGLANNGRSPTVSELKQENKITYLKVEQDSPDGTGRFLFYCLNREIVLMAGMITTKENTQSTLEWATNSFLSFDNEVLLKIRREKDSQSMFGSKEALWASRTLSKPLLAKLIRSKEISVWFAADGMVAYGGRADIRKVKLNIQKFIQGCNL